MKISVSKTKLKDLCQRHHIRKLSFFGSVLRDDFRPDSDIDVLVEFLPKATPGFFSLYRIRQELSQLLNERNIDLRTPEDLSRYFRQEILDTAELYYEAA